MSGGSVFLEGLRILRSLELPEVAERDVLAALEAARPGSLSLLYEAGVNAGLPRDVLLRRAAACHFAYAGGSLADDIADGDCTYLEEPLKTGTCAVFLLQHLFLYAMAGTGVPSEVLSSAGYQLVQAAARQHIEVRTHHWTATLFKEMAEISAGAPFVAWLRMLWYGTPLFERAESIGFKIGIVGQTSEDLRSNDPRFTTLSATDRREVLAWALAAAGALHDEPLSFLQPFLRAIEPRLREASEEV